MTMQETIERLEAIGERLRSRVAETAMNRHAIIGETVSAGSSTGGKSAPPAPSNALGRLEALADSLSSAIDRLESENRQIGETFGVPYPAPMGRQSASRYDPRAPLEVDWQKAMEPRRPAHEEMGEDAMERFARDLNADLQNTPEH